MDFNRAQEYLSELGLSNVGTKIDAAQLMGPSRLELLNEVIEAYSNKVPFHNLGLLCAIEDKLPLKLPPDNDVIEKGLNRIGGLCYEKNIFLSELLNTIGYRCHFLLAGVSSQETDNHVVIVTRDILSEGDQYLLEGGFIYPTFRAIPLDFADGSCSDVYYQSIQPFRYTLRNDTYIRQHKVMPGIESRYPIVENGWIHAYFFKLNPYQKQDLRDILERTVYSNIDMYFSQNLRIVLWNHNQHVSVRNQTLEVEGTNRDLTKQHLDTSDCVIDAVVKHFPMLPPALAIRAVGIWSRNCSGANAIKPPE